MHIALVTGDGEPGYAGELLQAWGLRMVRAYQPADVAQFDPVVIPTVMLLTDAVDAEVVLRYVRSGGTLVCCQPAGPLADAAGLRSLGDRALPALLRMTAYIPPGLAGEMLPIVGHAVTYARQDDTAILGYLCDADDTNLDSPGLTSTAVGDGRILAFAFDLPQCVQWLRQGDPARQERVPPGDGCPRPAQLACLLPAHDAGWVPFADLLALLLVDLLVRALPYPLPLLSHLPEDAPAILLYSGDEDNASPEATQEQLDWLTSRQARMDLYVIPERTPTTVGQLQDYRQRHDAGPHPDLRHLDGQSVAVRLADLERQIRLFIERYGFQPLCLRNHCIVWPGYTEMVVVLERCGIRMDTNYTSGQYRAGRQYAPYAAFGGALPIRFCGASGQMFDVYQQHTHIMDDIWFAPDAGIFQETTYSFRFGPPAFEVIVARIFDDMVGRLHTPLGVCIHPSNWVRFSADQGKALVRHAQQRNIPIWSITEWCQFWDKRARWQFDEYTWDEGLLRVRLSGDPDARLRLQLPLTRGERTLKQVSVDGLDTGWTPVVRYRESVALVTFPPHSVAWELVAVYD
ncbi:MAG: type 1 glutamine amidotransferase family protein [Armatimonadota bacterium]